MNEYDTWQQNELGIEQRRQRGEFRLQPACLERRAEHYAVRQSKVKTRFSFIRENFEKQVSYRIERDKLRL